MASNHSEQQHNAPNVTIVMSGNRGRPKIKIVPLKPQSAPDEQQLKAEQKQKERLKQQQGMCSTWDNHTCVTWKLKSASKYYISTAGVICVIIIITCAC